MAGNIPDTIYKIAICDDDRDYGLSLKEKLSALIPQASFYLYQSGEELLMAAEVMHDLIFLDIQMKGIDGNATAAELRKYNQGAVLVFCSGVCQPTPESIKVAPYRYLMKQFSDREMDAELREILRKMKSTPRHDYLLVRRSGEAYRIRTVDILYIAKQKRGSMVYALDDRAELQQHATDEHVRDLQKRLGEVGFAFPHDSYLVNCRWVKAFRKDFLILDDGTPDGLQLNISRSRREGFKAYFMEYWDKYGETRG